MLAALALVVGACSDGDVVATVNGENIMRADVLVLRTDYGDTGVVSGEQFRQDLSLLIFKDAITQQAETEFGIVIEDATVAQQLTELTGQELGFLLTLGDEEDLTEAYALNDAAIIVARAEVSEALLTSDSGFLEDLFVNRRGTITQVCMRHILVPSVEEAQDIAEQLAGGADFAALATEASLDQQSPGGALPCPTVADDFVSGFADAGVVAPLGEVFGPVSTDFGWHVIIVDQRVGPETLEELRADPRRFVDPNLVVDLWQPWFNDAIRNADIVVDEAVGSWFHEGSGIRPPPG